MAIDFLSPVIECLCSKKLLLNVVTKLIEDRCTQEHLLTLGVVLPCGGGRNPRLIANSEVLRPNSGSTGHRFCGHGIKNARPMSVNLMFRVQTSPDCAVLGGRRPFVDLFCSSLFRTKSSYCRQYCITQHRHLD